MRLNLTISDELSERLGQIAAKLGYSRAAVASQMLEFVSSPMVAACKTAKLPPHTGGTRRQSSDAQHLQQLIALLAIHALPVALGDDDDGQD